MRAAQGLNITTNVILIAIQKITSEAIMIVEHVEPCLFPRAEQFRMNYI